MGEWRAVSGAPGELGHHSNSHWVFDQILRSEVSDFLLVGIILHGVREKFRHLHSSDLSYVSNIMLRLYLVKMHKVMDHPKVVVIVHFHVKGLHGFGASSALLNSTIYLKLRLHKVIILSTDSINNIWSVDVS